MRSAALLLALGVAASEARAQLAVAALGEGAYVQHRVSAGAGVELSSGTAFGGRLALRFGPAVELRAAAASGTLTPDSGAAEDADLARGEVALTVLPVPWLGIRAAFEQHTFSTPVVVQRWTSLRLGGEGRLWLSGGLLSGLLRFEFFPVVSVSGLERPNRAFGAASGVELRSGIVTASLVYQLERYDFPSLGAIERREQVSWLTASVGLGLGGRRAAR